MKGRSFVEFFLLCFLAPLLPPQSALSPSVLEGDLGFLGWICFSVFFKANSLRFAVVSGGVVVSSSWVPVGHSFFMFVRFSALSYRSWFTESLLWDTPPPSYTCPPARGPLRLTSRNIGGEPRRPRFRTPIYPFLAGYLDLRVSPPVHSLKPPQFLVRPIRLASPLVEDITIGLDFIMGIGLLAREPL